MYVSKVQVSMFTYSRNYIFLRRMYILTIFMSGSKKTALVENALEEEGKTTMGC